nr:Bm8633 [Brugia malayi]
MTLLTSHSDQIQSTTTPKISTRSVLINEKTEDVEENITNHDNDKKEEDEECGDALLDGYPVDLEFHHAVHQRTESFRAFFRR